MAALFDIKNVSYPSTIKTNTAFKVTGDVTLFSIPFYMLLWVAVTVTYPKQWWEIIGSPETASVAISKLGKFEVEFPDGFDREGDYTVDIRAFAGPTIIMSPGFISSASVTIPPFPSVVILPQKQFTVAGQGGDTTGQALAFNMGNPTINPSTVEIGKETTITLPVKNVGRNPQTFTVQIKITEMGATGISPPGTTVGSQTFGPYTLQPGATQNIVFNWTATGDAKGKWLVASVLVNDELAPNTSPNNPTIFKQEFEVVSPVVGFQLLNPVINPTAVMQGQTTRITFDVVNNSTYAQAVKLHADITEMGATGISPPGSTVDSYDNQATIQPGQHWNPVWTWTAKGASAGKWIVVSLMDSSGKLTPNTGPNNPNIFKQEFEVVSPVVSFQLLNPVINPTAVVQGQTTSITFDVVNNSTYAQAVKLHADITETGATGISPPGNTVDSYDNQATIQPGQHWNPVWIWTAKGASAGKWIVVSLMDTSGKLTPNTGPNNPNIFKQEFWVLSPSAVVSIVLQQPTPSANLVPVGSTVVITVPFVLSAPVAQTVKVKATLQYAGSGTSSIDASTQTKTVTAQPNVTTNVSFTFTVDDGGDVGAVYSGGLNERKLKVDCYINEQTVAGNVFAHVFYAQRIPKVVPELKISNPNIAQFGKLSFSFSGFHPNSNVRITVVQTGGYLNITSDANGKGSASFIDNDPPGNYTLKATDAYGNQATASFTISAAAPEVTLTSLNIPSQAAYGQTVAALLGFSYRGSATDLILEVSLGAKGWWGGAFTVESGMKWQKSISVAAATSPTSRSGTVNITIPNGVPTKLYDVLSRVLDQSGNELASRIDSGMVTIISGAAAATLTASYSNGICSFSFSGFQPNATVTLTVTQTGGYLTATANSTGSGSGSFYTNDPAGTYTLRATDNYGHSATATFTKT